MRSPPQAVWSFKYSIQAHSLDVDFTDLKRLCLQNTGPVFPIHVAKLQHRPSACLVSALLTKFCGDINKFKKKENK
jgi:hypothetical protein